MSLITHCDLISSNFLLKNYNFTFDAIIYYVFTLFPPPFPLRVAGNAAYILGTVAENELGCYRIISMTQACSPRCNTILIDLTNMLAFDDSESMMNAAGTIGTLVRRPRMVESCF